MPDVPIAHLILRAKSADQLAEELVALWGPLVRIADIWKMLGYRSPDAARKAAARNQLGLEPIVLPGRRGKFVRAPDLANWLYETRPVNPREARLNQT